MWRAWFFDGLRLADTDLGRSAQLVPRYTTTFVFWRQGGKRLESISHTPNSRNSSKNPVPHIDNHFETIPSVMSNHVAKWSKTTGSTSPDSSVWPVRIADDVKFLYDRVQLFQLNVYRRACHASWSTPVNRRGVEWWRVKEWWRVRKGMGSKQNWTHMRSNIWETIFEHHDCCIFCMLFHNLTTVVTFKTNLKFTNVVDNRQRWGC